MPVFTDRNLITSNLMKRLVVFSRLRNLLHKADKALGKYIEPRRGEYNFLDVVSNIKLTEAQINEEIHKHQTEYISLQVDDVAHAATLLEQMDITNFSVLDQEFIRIYDSNISGKVLSKALIESGVGLESLGRKQDTLEDYFFQLTEERK